MLSIHQLKHVRHSNLLSHKPLPVIPSSFLSQLLLWVPSFYLFEQASHLNSHAWAHGTSAVRRDTSDLPAQTEKWHVKRVKPRTPGPSQADVLIAFVWSLHCMKLSKDLHQPSHLLSVSLQASHKMSDVCSFDKGSAGTADHVNALCHSVTANACHPSAPMPTWHFLASATLTSFLLFFFSPLLSTLPFSLLS